MEDGMDEAFKQMRDEILGDKQEDHKKFMKKVEEYKEKMEEDMHIIYPVGPYIRRRENAKVQ